MDQNNMPVEVARIVALLAAAIVNGGRGNVSYDSTMEMAKKFEKYVKGGQVS